MEATSSLKKLVNRVGIALGALSIMALVPVAWTISAIIQGTATGLSTIEYYTRFIMERPFILGVFVICIVWMMLVLNSKQAKQI